MHSFIGKLQKPHLEKNHQTYIVAPTDPSARRPFPTSINGKWLRLGNLGKQFYLPPRWLGSAFWPSFLPFRILLFIKCLQNKACWLPLLSWEPLWKYSFTFNSSVLLSGFQHSRAPSHLLTLGIPVPYGISLCYLKLIVDKQHIASQRCCIIPHFTVHSILS